MNENGAVIPPPSGNAAQANAPAADPSGGWELEESLDVEWAHAIAPQANIILVEAGSTSTNDLMTAVQTAANHANVVSMSWGGGEFSGETSGTYQNAFNTGGVTFVAAAGDAGATVTWPAISTSVLSVGGTSLNIAGGTETAWVDGGGGLSRYFARPSYQPTSYANGSSSVSLTARGNPDVSYDADPQYGFAVYDSTPYYPYYPFSSGAQDGWFQVGGTSAAAPQWAAIVAIADQVGSTSLSTSQVLADLYRAPGDFNDITSGTTTTGGRHAVSFTAGTGYDLATGLGSPIAYKVIATLA